MYVTRHDVSTDTTSPDALPSSTETQTPASPTTFPGMMRPMAWAVLLIVAWGAVAFGGVYEWAYWPLLATTTLVTAWAFARPRSRARMGGHRAVAGAAILVVAVIGAQLIPLDRTTLQSVSPWTDAFLLKYDVLYALRTQALAAQKSADELIAQRAPNIERVVHTPIRHPISIHPQKTWLGLAFFVVLAVLGVVLALIAIVQKALWNGKVYGLWEPVNAGVVAFGPFINRNHFAGWMLLALPVVVGYFAAQVAKGMEGVRPHWRDRLVWWSTGQANRTVLLAGAILVMAIALAMTVSRSGISCFLLAIALSGFHVFRHQAGTGRKRWLAAYLALVIVLALGWAGFDAIAGRFAQVDWQLGGRAAAWDDAWRIHQKFPWFGTGFNTYGTATVLYQQNDLAAHYVEAHNDYLQILVEGGWILATAFALLIVALVREIVTRFREAHDDRTGFWIRLGAVTGLVAMACQEIVEFSLQIPANALLCGVLCAIAIRRSSLRKTPHPVSGRDLGAIAHVGHIGGPVK
jgi:O-antigen ligase